MKANENNILSGSVAPGGVFDWSNFDEERFNMIKEEYKDRKKEWEASYGEANKWWDYDGTEDGDYEGSVRIGELCFDIETKLDSQGRERFGFTLYVGGIDSGYSCSKENEYPYDEVDGGNFDSCWAEMNFNCFKSYAEDEFNDFIDEMNEYYKEADLREKANEPLHIW